MSSRLERERAFHDELAGELRADRLPPRPPDRFERMVLDAAGPLAGLDVLELGCGTGDLTLELLRRGARVTAIDLAPAMVELAAARAALYRPEAEARFAVAPVEQTGLAGEAFDAVVGKWIIHHVDVRAAAAELRRVMRPGAAGIFYENSGLNPLLTAARRHLAGRFGVAMVGTRDEHPLTRADYAILGERVGHCRVEFPLVFMFEMFDARVLRHRSATASAALSGLDRLIWRLAPRLRRLSYHAVVRVTRTPA